MTTLELIKQTGAGVAFENEIIANKNNQDISIPNGLAEDFILRVKSDLFEFNTLEQFDYTHCNLFNRAFIYVYGKGAEAAFFSKLGNSILKINYEFDKLMKGICGEKLPDHILLCLNKKSSAMIDMYVKMFQLTRGSQEKMISENITFQDCISTILSAAFFYGFEVCLTCEFIEKDKLTKYPEESDVPYNYNTYDQKYKIDDYNFKNFKSEI